MKVSALKTLVTRIPLPLITVYRFGNDWRGMSLNLLSAIILCLIFADTISATPASCSLKNETLHINANESCVWSEDVGHVNLASWVMGDNSRITFKQTKKHDSESISSLVIHAKKAQFGNNVVIDTGGINGVSGRKGSDDRRGVGRCHNGVVGVVGAAGGPGSSGRDVDITVNFHSLGSLTIDTSGGFGGNGGNGGKGGPGGRAATSPTYYCNGGTGGTGGRGGNGGNGGSAGDISLALDMSGVPSVIALLDKITLLAKAGRAGTGGVGGAGGNKGRRYCKVICKSSGRPGAPGEKGASGSSGANGTIDIKVGKVFVKEQSLEAGAHTAMVVNEEVVAACVGVAQRMPRYMSMRSVYAVDVELDQYIYSQLQKVISLEASGRITDTVKGYRVIDKELARLDLLFRSKLKGYWRRMNESESRQERIKNIENIIDNAEKNGCFLGGANKEFKICRQHCLEETETKAQERDESWQPVSDDKGNWSEVRVGERETGSESRTVGVVGGCVPECMKEVRLAASHEACGKLNEERERIVREMGQVERQVPSVRLTNMFLFRDEKRRSSESERTEWQGAVVVEAGGNPGSPGKRAYICGFLESEKAVQQCYQPAIQRWKVDYRC